MPNEIPHVPRRRGKQNRPIEHPWHQQKMSAVRPYYTIRTAGPILVALGAAMFALGISMYFAVENSLEFEVEYTNCKTLNHTDAHELLTQQNQNGNISSNGTLNSAPIKCEFQFSLDKPWGKDGKDVKFYYKLNGFYQNFRLYLSSRDDLQLAGGLTRNGNDLKDCEPYAYGYGHNTTNYPIVPCGIIANSLFNDTFKMYYHTGNSTVRVPFSALGLMNQREIDRKFINPDPIAKDYTTNETLLCNAFAAYNAVRPKSWQKDVCQLSWNPEDDEMFEGLSDQEKLDEKIAVGQGLRFFDFMVWMKPAALPSFRKTYRRLKRINMFSDGLSAGNYTVVVNYNYPVVDYKIRKYFVLTSESWMGPRIHFLPIIYMVTGAFCLLLGGVFLVGCICKRILIRPVDKEPPVIRMEHLSHS